MCLVRSRSFLAFWLATTVRLHLYSDTVWLTTVSGGGPFFALNSWRTHSVPKDQILQETKFVMTGQFPDLSTFGPQSTWLYVCGFKKLSLSQEENQQTLKDIDPLCSIWTLKGAQSRKCSKNFVQSHIVVSKMNKPPTQQLASYITPAAKFRRWSAKQLSFENFPRHPSHLPSSKLSVTLFFSLILTTSSSLYLPDPGPDPGRRWLRPIDSYSWLVGSALPGKVAGLVWWRNYNMGLPKAHDNFSQSQSSLILDPEFKIVSCNTERLRLPWLCSFNLQ